MNRMRLWRAKKMSQEAGRLTQICVWAPESDAELVRNICTRVAEPTERGRHLRNKLRQQVERRRTIYAQWHGGSWEIEIDLPFVGPWWFMRNIGGRVAGPFDTHIELSPEEVGDLKRQLDLAFDTKIEEWLRRHKLTGCVRDNTGVLTTERIVNALLGKEADRPADEAAFAANEARIARAVVEAGYAERKPPVKDPSVIEYEGISGFPSFCQIAHRRQGERVQFALIHMKNGGTSPTNMFACLATLMRQHFYPDVDASRIDWFDVLPKDVYSERLRTDIIPVVMQHANGIYSESSWSGPEPSQDWVAFVEAVIDRGQSKRRAAEDALTTNKAAKGKTGESSRR